MKKLYGNDKMKFETFQAFQKPTLVIFRVWNNGGGFIALFPEIIETKQGLMLSYERQGQHAPADYLICIDETRPARPEEYKGLYDELISLGYSQLNVIPRASMVHYLKSISRIRKGHKSTQ